MSTRLFAHKWLIALLFLALTAAACSDDDNSGGGGMLRGDAGGDGDAAASADAGAQDVYNPCDEGKGYCDGQCVDILASEQNCGACGATCFSWNAECVEGTCICDDENFSYCDGFCVDTQTDTANCGTCGNVCAEGSACYEGDCLTGLEQADMKIRKVVEETNKVRSTETDCGEYGVLPPADPLTHNPYLGEAAQAHSEDMATNNFHAHEGSDGSSPADRVDRTDFQGSYVGENVAMGYETAEAVVQAWVDSDGHCNNLMNPDATLIGVGYAYDDNADGHTRWTQDFGK